MSSLKVIMSLQGPKERLGVDGADIYLSERVKQGRTRLYDAKTRDWIVKDKVVCVKILGKGT